MAGNILISKISLTLCTKFETLGAPSKLFSKLLKFCIMYFITLINNMTDEEVKHLKFDFSWITLIFIFERLCRAGPKGRARGRPTLGVHWLLSNNRLEPFASVPHTFSNRLLLSNNQGKGCTPSVAHSLGLPLGPALHNVWTVYVRWYIGRYWGRK